MPLDFNTLTPEIERVINMIATGYNRAPGSILTEADLQGHLQSRLSRLRPLRNPVPTLDPYILGSHVHLELPWYDERGKLRIRPDITIIEPEEMSILHGCSPPVIDPFSSAHGFFPRARPLPSKQYEFAGKAVILELKFARTGINRVVFEKVRYDLNKVMRLFRKLDQEGEGESVFAFLVVFNKLPQKLEETPLADFVRQHGSGPRHRILYRACHPRPATEPADRRYSGRNDLVITCPPTSARTLSRGVEAGEQDDEAKCFRLLKSCIPGSNSYARCTYSRTTQLQYVAY